MKGFFTPDRNGGIIASIISLFLIVSCGTSQKKEEPPAPHKISDITMEALIWADSIVEKMTLEQQTAQLLMPALYARTGQDYMERLKWYTEELGVGGVLLLKGDAASASVIADTLEVIRGRSKFPAGFFVSVDAETGLGMRFSDAPLFPWNRNISPEVNDQTFYDYGREVGREAHIAGINMILGPVVDVDRNEKQRGVMRLRSLGSDQLRVAELSLAYAAGLESQGIISVAKHFPGHGPTATDSHNGMPVISLSKDEIYSIDLMPFRSYIAHGLSGIMVGHIWSQALDTVKRPASFSPVIIKQLLRKEMDFKGLVLVDAVAMGGAKGYTAADAIEAGADIIIAPEDTEGAIREIIGAVNSGRIGPGDVRDRAKRILFYKYLFNIHSGSRKNLGLDPEEIKERLHEEALPIIDSLKAR